MQLEKDPQVASRESWWLSHLKGKALRYGDVILALAAEFLAYAEVYGKPVVYILHRMYRNLVEEWISSVDDLDPDDVFFWRAHNFAYEEKKPWMRDVYRTNLVSHEYIDTHLYMRGIGFLIKAPSVDALHEMIAQQIVDEQPIFGTTLISKIDGWLDVGRIIRALDITMRHVENMGCYHDGNETHLYDISTNLKTYKTVESFEEREWTEIESSRTLDPIERHALDIQNRLAREADLVNSEHWFWGRARGMISGEMDDLHDLDKGWDDARKQIMSQRETRDVRIIRVAAFTYDINEDILYMEDTTNDIIETKHGLFGPQDRANKRGLGPQPYYLPKVPGKKDKDPERHRYRTVFSRIVEARAQFEVVMQRAVLESAPQPMDFEFGHYLSVDLKNPLINGVSRRTWTPLGVYGRWIVRQYETGTKAVMLVLPANALHRVTRIPVRVPAYEWDNDLMELLDVSETVLKRYENTLFYTAPRCPYIGIDVVGEKADDVMRAMGYRVQYYWESVGKRGAVKLRSTWARNPRNKSRVLNPIHKPVKK